MIDKPGLQKEQKFLIQLRGTTTKFRLQLDQPTDKNFMLRPMLLFHGMPGKHRFFGGKMLTTVFHQFVKNFCQTPPGYMGPGTFLPEIIDEPE